MNYIPTLIRQISIMFITMGISLLCKKKKIIGDAFIKDLGNLLFIVINPLSIFNSFCTEYTREKAINILIAFVICIAIVLIAITIANTLYRDDKYVIEKFAMVINNPGFFGIPIVAAVLGSQAVFYVAPFVVINTIVQYTYGSYIMSKDINEVSIKKIITNTSVIATALGFIFFFCRIPLPSIISATCSTLSSMMGSMCAIIIGANLANTNFKGLKNDLSTIPVYIVRLIVLDLIAIFILRFIPCEEILKMTIAISLATPSGASTAVFARNYDCNATKAARVVSVCSLLTIITMPLVVSLTSYIW